MNYTEYKITLDVNKTVSQVAISVKKGDTARRLLITLRQGGYPYHITEECYAVIAAKKPDGYVIFNNCSIENCVIRYDFTEQTVAAVGLMNCEVIVYGARGAQLSSASFDIIVEESNYRAVESSSEANAFSALIQQIQVINTLGLKAPAIVDSIAGAMISISGSTEEALQGLRIFGKSTQAAVPSLDAPVEIVNLGAAGEIAVCVLGQNLLDTSRITYTAKNTAIETADSAKIIKYYATGNADAFANVEMAMNHLAGRKIYVTYDKKTTNQSETTGYLQIKYYLDGARKYIENAALLAGPIEIPAEAYDIRFSIYFENKNVAIESGAWVQYEGLRVSFVEGSVWEPYKEPQMLSLATPSGLPGIPVAIGGNYTDADGQQWICDEIDLGRGVYVQRVRRFPVSNPSTYSYGELSSHARVWLGLGDASYSSIDTPNGMSNIMPMIANFSADQLHFYAQNHQLWVFVPLDEMEERTIEGALEWLTSKGSEFLYILKTPIETALPAEDIAAFADLHSYKPNTTILNDVGAHMVADYVVDTKTYVDRHRASGGLGGSSVTIGTVTLLAAKWAGDTDPYSQVVSIPGVTEYSQVDLKPSVEQLTIFHDKDLAFVTENDGGVVTVYAIGEKPTNDYTMQVTITEVNV